MKDKRRRVILLLYLSLQVHCGYFMILRKVTHIWRFMFLMTLVDWCAVLDWLNVVSTLIGTLAIICCSRWTGMLAIMCCSRWTGMLVVICCLSTLAIMCCLRLESNGSSKYWQAWLIPVWHMLGKDCYSYSWFTLIKALLNNLRIH